MLSKSLVYSKVTQLYIYSFCLFFKFLPCCVGFHHTAMHISHNYTCIYAIIHAYIHLLPPSPPSPHPFPPGDHRAPDWTPCAIQQLFTSYPSYTWLCIYILMLLSPFIPFFPSRTKNFSMHGNTKDRKKPKQSWERKTELEESTFLTSDYTTKLQSSIQYGTGTKTEIWTNEQDRMPRDNAHAPVGTLSLTKEARIYHGEMTASSISGAGKTGQLHAKE